MKPMLPSLSFEAPNGKDWLYEVKYDGFRAILHWSQSELSLKSRNGKSLLEIFPEIKFFLDKNIDSFRPFLPITLDGELVFLENAYKAHFGQIQVRGRMRAENRIAKKANSSPCHLLIFDILELKGESLKDVDYLSRKKKLAEVFKHCSLPLQPNENSNQLMQLIPFYHTFQEIWDKVTLYDGEGIVAKQELNKWEEGKRTTLWIKYKNWKYVSCFITAYEKTNGYYYAAVYQNNQVFPIGQFLFGLKPDEKKALFEIIKANKTNEDAQFIYVEPGICVEVKYLEIYEGQIREPHFHTFRFDLKPDDCKYEQFIQQQKNLPSDIEVTHPDKPLWEDPPIQKIDYIHYLREISPYMLPFLKNRLLTVIRYPHGIFGDPFYQKNCPDYAPEFVETNMSEGINYIVCNHLKTLLWLGNQLSFEFHIPFQTIYSKGPSEIVFDLDPPSRDEFGLAIRAALLIKEVLEQLKLLSFVKISGNKGLQIYIPLPENTYSYEDTRLFTSFIAEYLISKDPDSFTIERMKKNRGKRLYVDYIQHAEGKTIVCPYSPRGTKEATVAAPLFWEEVEKTLRVEDFQIPEIIKRVNQLGDPFKTYFETKDKQNFEPILQFLKDKKGLP
ncbi:DNA ligase D [Bacillus sp. DTU_2020_1000418_1_SI_GHA_SEK_038]|uniref:DNA ligase D n=1 Tax=Bacillus sp. DTU_2020_1000418_1_SI_GHA_SEK_038 TaxID=3077585 RepID=UPI0028ECB4D9|nr:DNA ligase D [Bacillus sp. DTU_2020_1000418_1_SI_GHA_SEK_038]WNS77603.1 DNA ligase D [Bacillus sp. DTU_2020_1000418_1_SI_GHA_SEK_038]